MLAGGRSGRVLAGLVMLSALTASGCGSGTPTSATGSHASSGHLSTLAHRCGEPESVMALQITAALKALDTQGLRGSRAELTEGLDTVAAYVATRERTVDCERLLEAFIARFKQRARHTTFKERTRQGLSGSPTLLTVEPPAAVARAGGTRLDEFKLGRVVTAQTGCLACHRIGGQGNNGPGRDLTNVGSRLSPRQLERALISSKEPMPSFKLLPRPKFKAVVQFLSLLRK